MKLGQILACLFALQTTIALAETHDLVMLNGRVIDPASGLDAVRNVGITGDKISAVSEFPLEGHIVIDASGHVVAPGFIDLHAHGMALGDMRMQVVQGVTTVLELESGVLPIGDWYDNMQGQVTPINYGASAAWTFSRIATFSDTAPEATANFFQDAQAWNEWKLDIADPLQTARIMELVEQGLSLIHI